MAVDLDSIDWSHKKRLDRPKYVRKISNIYICMTYETTPNGIKLHTAKVSKDTTEITGRLVTKDFGRAYLEELVKILNMSTQKTMYNFIICTDITYIIENLDPMKIINAKEMDWIIDGKELKNHDLWDKILCTTYNQKIVVKKASFKNINSYCEFVKQLQNITKKTHN